jgi:hypothetical protein
VSDFHLMAVIVGSIVVAELVIEALGYLFHLAGRRWVKLIAGMIPKAEPTIEPPAKPDGFATWLQRPRR